MRLSLLVPARLALGLSCNDDDTDATDGPPAGPIVATVVPSPHVAAVALVSFEGEGDAFVEYGLAGAFDRANRAGIQVAARSTMKFSKTISR